MDQEDFPLLGLISNYGMEDNVVEEPTGWEDIKIP
jgi:hypothetical protein